eukprot:197302_1
MFASRFRWYQPARHVQRARHTPFVRVLSLKTRPVKTDTGNQNDILESQTKLRSLAFRHPKVAAEFHPTKNGDISPTKLRYSSNKSVWWQCGREKHEWQASLNSRTNMGCGCPFCSGYHVTSKNSLAVQKPKVAAEFHPSKNGDLSLTDLHVSSRKKVWWLCATDPEHEWQANPKIAAEFHPSKNGDLSLTDGDLSPYR